MSKVSPVQVIKDLITLGQLTFLWCDGEEAVFASHANDDPGQLFADLTPTSFRDRAHGDVRCFTHRYFGSA